MERPDRARLERLLADTRPVGRLAPSPTGELHLGHARSFLLAWWSVRSRGGRVLLRVEDLDRERCKPELVDLVLRDLEWLGLDWDGPIAFQSRDLRHYAEALDELVARGDVYPCVCTRSEIRAAQSAPQEGGGELRYPGTCRGRFATVDEALAHTDRPLGWRFYVPAGELPYSDGLRGGASADVQAEVGDFLVARRDGHYAYQLAVVVDDRRQGVTEVLRGDDLRSSIPRQELLYDALQASPPVWLHAPLVVDETGRRLAKRAGDLSLASLREAGVDPRAVVGWCAASAGQEVPERVEAAEVVASFDLARLPLEPVVLSHRDLARMSGR